MSDRLVQSLGFVDYRHTTQSTQFELTNGMIVESVGQVSASCSFGHETDVVQP